MRLIFQSQYSKFFACIAVIHKQELLMPVNSPGVEIYSSIYAFSGRLIEFKVYMKEN